MYVDNTYMYMYTVGVGVCGQYMYIHVGVHGQYKGVRGQYIGEG